MKRKSAVATTVALLAGAVAVVFLVISVLREEDASRRDRSGGGSAAAVGGSGGGEASERGTVATVVRDRGARSGEKGAVSRFGKSAIPKREVVDDPATVAERTRMSSRVLALLDKLRTLDRSKVTERHNTRREIHEILRKLGSRVSPGVKQQLLEMLHSVEPGFRYAIGDILGAMQGDEGVAEALIAKLRDRTIDDTYTRNAIYVALGKINVPGVNDELMDMLGKNYPLEHRIVQTLGQTAGTEEARKLLDMLGKPLKRQTEAAILQVLRIKRNLPGLLDDVAKKMEASSDPHTQQTLLSVLALSKDEEHRKRIHRLFESTPHATVRQAAIRTLGKLGDRKSGRMLLDLVESGTPDERRRAVAAMNLIRDAETVDDLAQHWDRLEPEGRRAVMSASTTLARPTERIFELAREEGLRDEDMLTRTRAARVLGRRGADENVEPLARFLLDAEHAGERTAAIRALQKIRTKKAAEAALSALHVVPQKVRRDQYVQAFEKILARSTRRQR